jgi:hypothetical protein
MVLTTVVQDDTMPVAGFEHQTFTCSECQDVEQRLVFARHDRAVHTGPTSGQAAPSVVPAATVQDEQIAAPDLAVHPLELPATATTQTAPLELTQAAQPETPAQVQTSPTVPGETLPTAPPFQKPVWRKALAKLHTFKERAIETERRTQFNRVWDNLRAAPGSSAPPEAASLVNLEEPVRSATEPVASAEPAACSEAPGRESKA